MLGSMQGSLDYGEISKEKGKKLKPQKWNKPYVKKIETEAIAFVKTVSDNSKQWMERIENVFGLLVNAVVRRCAHRYVIGLDPLEFKIFLHRNSHRGSPTPDSDDEVRFKTILENLMCQAE